MDGPVTRRRCDNRSMKIIDAATVAARLDPARLLPALEHMFRDGCTAPTRHHHTIGVPGEPDAVLLLMPAWRAGAYLGIKLVTVFPGNAGRGLPAVSAGYLLMDGGSGTVLAMIDGGELTAKRTAATSALAARFLARGDARTLLVLGTGRIARELARCHVAARPSLERVLVWGRSAAHAATLAAELAREGIGATPAPDLEAATGAADIVASATLATEPLVRGAWVRPGTHVDLVGGYTPAMREADDALIAKARVFADTRAGALQEAGDLVVPIARGVLAADSVVDLQGLCRRESPGRRNDAEVTVFKSVGAALEDLAAAILVYESA
jgi:alanine dehydrogenase